MSDAFQGKRLGGYPSTAVPAQMVGRPPEHQVAPQGSSPVIGGQDWVGDERCLATLKDSGWLCPANRKPGSLYCFGHRDYSPSTEE